MALVDENTGFFGGSSAIFFLFILFLFGGGNGFGWGGWGNNGFMNGWNSPTAQGTLTRADINEGLVSNRILDKQDTILSQMANNALSQQRDILTEGSNTRESISNASATAYRDNAAQSAFLSNQILGSSAALSEKVGNTNKDVVLGNCGLQKDILLSTANINSNLNDARFALANANCETNHRIDMTTCDINRNVDQSRFATVKQTGDIINAIHADGEATRALITGNVIQGLRDRLQNAEQMLTSQSQVSQIVDRMRQTPTPSWMVQSPYQSYTPQVVVSGYTPGAAYSYPGYNGFNGYNAYGIGIA